MDWRGPARLVLAAALAGVTKPQLRNHSPTGSFMFCLTPGLARSSHRQFPFWRTDDVGDPLSKHRLRQGALNRHAERTAGSDPVFNFIETARRAEPE